MHPKSTNAIFIFIFVGVGMGGGDQFCDIAKLVIIHNKI